MRSIAALFILALLAAPAAVRASESACEPGKIIGSGSASWYGPGLNGEQDARGKRFDEHALTAASKTLPLGTLVQVTNRRNHQTVVVEITDRGPYAKDRIIDLSQAAAQKLGFGGRGVARVTLRLCKKEKEIRAAAD